MGCTALSKLATEVACSILVVIETATGLTSVVVSLVTANTVTVGLFRLGDLGKKYIIIDSIKYFFNKNTDLF